MSLRSISILFCIAAIAMGCKSGDTTATDAPAAPVAGTAKAPETPPATENSIVGTWTNDDKDMKDGVIEFKNDGTLAMTGSDPKGISLEAAATYKLEGDKLTVQMTSMKMTAPSGADEKTKKDVEDTNKLFTAEAVKKEPANVDTIAWKDKDTFTTTSVGGTQKGKVTTFKRKV